jgi:hypothetical protein
MTLSTVQSNNKLVKYTEEINFEYVRENLFSPYMGEDITSIIRIRNQMKTGGEQMNIPLVARLKGTGFSTGTLTGQEEEIDDYGCRLWVDFARNAVKTNKYQQQIDSADVFGSAKPLLSDWGKELQRDEIIEAMMALPSEAAPVGLAGTNGNRVNGIKFQDATAAERNTWTAGNADRILFGATKANYNATFLTGLDMAKQAQPRIRPYKVEDGREYFVVFADGATFRDIKDSLYEVNKDARGREGGGFSKNPLARDGDLEWDGLIIREIPDIDPYVTTNTAGGGWSTVLTNTGTVLCHPVFLCGQSALSLGWGQMARPTFLKDDDYQFNTGAGVEMCYGVGKLFKKHPKASGPLKQWGIVTGFFAASGL